MTHRKVRKKFIDFFKSAPRNHMEIPSASLVPEGDPTTLFTGSGMQPLIPYLLGEKHPLGTRLVNSQKCFRAQDIDEVGDNRHTTFFEMLGNWSLGDYFKKEQLRWFFEFLTKELDLAPEKLYVTVFEGKGNVSKDKESIKIWKEIFDQVGIKARVGERIFTYEAEKNWWSRSGIPENMPPGEPGGPDSEVFYEFTNIAHNKKFGQKCHPNCDCGRFLEIGNSVFMQYQKQKDGSLKELTQKNVDFGGGLERLAAITQNQPDIFLTDSFSLIIETLDNLSQQKYSVDKNKPTMRIIADHFKAATFMIVDGVEPSNKHQGYILRRLIRRAVVKLKKLTLQESTSEVGKQICQTVGEIYKGVYINPNSKEFLQVKTTLTEEIDKFERVLNKGLKIFQKHSKINGKIAFDLHQTFGFPWELTAELALEKGQKVNYKEFQKEFKKHQETSRTSSKGMFRGGLADKSESAIKLHTATHLLHKSLREILGNNISQRGSHITSERLRFDFSHSHKLTNNEIKKIENLVNKKISQNLPVTKQDIGFNKAISQGALTVPNTKYPDMVKVYLIGDFSKEICGGPHVDFTGKLGLFKIVREESVGNNVRRIYAVLKNTHVDNQEIASKKRE